jgi:hypothetical protein
MPSFEVFTRRATPIVTQPIATIQKRGSISFNEAAFQAIAAPEAVELLFDRSARIVGLRGVDPSAAHAYPVRKQPNSKSFIVAGQAFTQYYGIDTSIARRYPAGVEEKTLVVDLKEEGLVVTGPWAQSDT